MFKREHLQQHMICSPGVLSLVLTSFESECMNVLHTDEFLLFPNQIMAFWKTLSQTIVPPRQGEWGFSMDPPMSRSDQWSERFRRQHLELCVVLLNSFVVWWAVLNGIFMPTFKASKKNPLKNRSWFSHRSDSVSTLCLEENPPVRPASSSSSSLCVVPRIAFSQRLLSAFDMLYFLCIHASFPVHSWLCLHIEWEMNTTNSAD